MIEGPYIKLVVSTALSKDCRMSQEPFSEAKGCD